jgi:predicted metal-binding protein
VRKTDLQPRIQIFVCTNVRPDGDPLASGCGAAGPGVYDALKREVMRSGRAADVWVTRTACSGHCPPRGCSVVIQPANEHWIEATGADAAVLLSRALETTRDRR